MGQEENEVKNKMGKKIRWTNFVFHPLILVVTPASKGSFYNPAHTLDATSLIHYDSLCCTDSITRPKSLSTSTTPLVSPDVPNLSTKRIVLSYTKKPWYCLMKLFSLTFFHSAIHVYIYFRITFLSLHFKFK